MLWCRDTRLTKESHGFLEQKNTGSSRVPPQNWTHFPTFLLHFSIPSPVISDRFIYIYIYTYTPKSHPLFSKGKKSFKNLHFWGFLSWKFIIAGMVFVGNCFYPSVEDFAKNAFVISFQVQLPHLNRLQGQTFDVQLAMMRQPAKQTPPPILEFLHLRKLRRVFFSGEKDSLPKNSGGKFRVANGIVPEEFSGKRMHFKKNSEFTDPDWFLLVRKFLQVMLGLHSPPFP